MNKQKYLAFKSYIAAQGGKSYDKEAGNEISYKRIMSFLGSTNKGNRNGKPGFLLEDDDAMKRRIFASEILKIDFERYLKIPREQLWGEMVTIANETFKDGNLYSWEPEWKDFREYNSRYVNEQTMNIEDLISKKFAKSNKVTGTLLTATEIMNILEVKNETCFSIGRKFSKLGYTHGSIGRGFNKKAGWRVEII